MPKGRTTDQVWTTFDYRYRDAGNFKANGRIWLRGRLSANQRSIILASLEAGEFFVAEQVGVPTLYAQLYEWSNGSSIKDDHCWHEFVAFTEFHTSEDDAEIWGAAKDFAQRFVEVVDWDGSLSVHFDLG